MDAAHKGPVMQRFDVGLNKFLNNIQVFGDFRCHETHVDGLVQDCSNSIAIALELLQSCTKPSISFKWLYVPHTWSWSTKLLVWKKKQKKNEVIGWAFEYLGENRSRNSTQINVLCVNIKQIPTKVRFQ